MIMHYSLLRSPQARSRLLQLPLELRLKILHFLHIEVELFKTVDLPRAEDHAIYSTHMDLNDIQLSGQVMQTCQQLYEEATEVLYGENVLFMNIRHFPEDWRAGKEDVQFTTFACCLDADPELRRSSCYNDIHSILQESRWYIWSRLDSEEREQFRMALSPYVSIFKRMKRVQITIVYTRSVDVYFCCRIMDSIFERANISIESRYEEVYHSGEEAPDIDHVLRSCTSLRCKSLEFLGLSESVAKSEVAIETKQIVEGVDPYNDLFDEWNVFTYRLVHAPFLSDSFDVTDELFDDKTFKEASYRLDTALATSNAEDLQHCTSFLKSYIKTLVLAMAAQVTDNHFANLDCGDLGPINRRWTMSLEQDYIF